MDRKDLLETMELTGQLGRKGHRDPPVTTELMVLTVLRDLKDYKVTRDHKDP